MGFDVVITCDWCGVRLPEGEILGEGEWTLDDEISWSQRSAVACCALHRQRLLFLWKLMPRDNEVEERTVFIKVSIPGSLTEPRRACNLRLSNATLSLEEFKKLTVTGTVESIVGVD